MMERIVRAPRSAFGFGTLMAAVIAFAVFVLGAPPWILVPVSLTGATVYAEVSSRVDRRVGKR